MKGFYFTMENKAYCILFNPLSGNRKGQSAAEELSTKVSAAECVDMTSIDNYEEFFASHAENDIIICGGDGTLNRFLNDTANMEITNSISYYASGTGNDFLRDIEGKANEVIDINKYIKNLPMCTINGKDYKFINGIGFGIDGYCCEVGDELRKKSDKPVNYTSIAIKGLLFHYKPTNATVTVDGVERKFKKVWIAPTMLGRFYGGGIMPNPEQNRLNEEGTVSTTIFHKTCRLRTLMIFPSLFKATRAKHEDCLETFTGKEITVEFDAPRALQVDGETILGVTKYTVYANSRVKLETK